MLLIGSRAAKFWFKDFPREVTSKTDYDYIIENKPANPDRKHEYYVANKHPPFKWILDTYYGYTVAPPEVLYTLKLSHSFWDVSWSKTAKDILFFQEKGVSYNQDLFQCLYNYWIKVHGGKAAKFNDHKYDKIREKICYGQRPLIEKIRGETGLEKQMFSQLPDADKDKLCREEIYAVSIGQYLIPEGFKLRRRLAYLLGLQYIVVCYPIPWLTKYIMTNFKDLQKDDGHRFIDKYRKKHKTIA